MTTLISLVISPSIGFDRLKFWSPLKLTDCLTNSDNTFFVVLPTVDGRAILNRWQLLKPYIVLCVIILEVVRFWQEIKHGLLRLS